MKIKLLILAILINLSFQVSSAQDGKSILEIRNRVNAINKNLKNYTKKTKDVEGISLEGTEAIFYTSGRGLHKISAKMYGETYNATTDLYYQGEELIFAHYKINRYDTQIRMNPPPKVVRVEEKRLYFVSGKMVKLLVGKNSIKRASKQWENSENDILELSKQLKNSFEN